MNCDEARRHWDLYHDSEGEAALHFAINEHLAVCPACAEWFSKQSRLEGLITDTLSAPAPTPQLWERIYQKTGLVQPARSQRWVMLSGLAASIALVVAVLFLFQHFSQPGTASADLVHLSAQWHQQLLQGQPVEFRSQSDLEVENYLRNKVKFPVRCPPRQDAGFQVQGAGICQMANQPTAYLLGQVDGKPVTILILADTSLPSFPQQRQALSRLKPHHSQEGEFHIVMGIIDRNAVLVIGQTPQAKLEKVLAAYGTYHDHPG